MPEAAAFGVLAGAMMVFPGAAAEAATEALTLWARAVAPVLGPFMVCMLMVSSHLNGSIALRTAMGWLCGSPGGARLMREAGLRGRGAMRAAAMTGTMSPMFFVGTVGGWLGDRRLGWMILACHILGAIAIGLCIRRPEKTDAPPAAPLPLGTALRESALALLTVAMCMMLGSVAARMAICAFPALPMEARAGLQCALEVTAFLPEHTLRRAADLRGLLLWRAVAAAAERRVLAGQRRYPGPACPAAGAACHPVRGFVRCGSFILFSPLTGMVSYTQEGLRQCAS